jgi:hypothetical protein
MDTQTFGISLAGGVLFFIGYMLKEKDILMKYQSQKLVMK